MGIKGIYGEIGPGERIAFSKLAVEKLERTGEPFRVAIDVSIWQFQTQSGQGGSNPAIRTFYYRLLRLLSNSVQPVFVFDGPNKPLFKRGKKSHYGGASVSDMLTKQMLGFFGFPFYRAPGEAEAECALLQRAGIVDAVLSEDVDTLMFGCGQTLRNWSSEGTRGNKTPTHVSVYNAKATKEGASGLDREGMVLVALMSGGDYAEGIPGCGIKVACQAARAGYGKSLCQIPQADTDGLEAWRQNLVYEIQTNQSKYFRTRHTTLTINENWPDRKILGYYTHPVVSSATRLERLKQEIIWDTKMDIPGLRQFAADAFEWTHKAGALKFIRGLAPVLLVHKLLLRRNRRESGYGDIVLTTMNEMELVRSIAAERKHFSTDASRELRLVYMPIDIVGLDLNDEHDDSEDYDRDGLAPLGEDGRIEGYVSDDAGKTGKGPSQYDPTQLDKVWVSATIAKIGIPLKVEDYEESLNASKKATKAKTAAKNRVKKAPAKKTVMPNGAMDRFESTLKPDLSSISKPSSPDYLDGDSLPPTFLAPMLEKASPSKTKTSEISKTSRSSSIRLEAKSVTITKSRIQSRTSSLSKSISTTPWSLSSTSQNALPTARITKSISTTQPPRVSKPIVYSLLSSSPVAPSPSPLLLAKSTPTKRQHSPKPRLSPLPSPLVRDFTSDHRDSLASLDAHEELGLPSTVTISRHRSGRSRRHRSYTPSRSQSPSRPSLRKRLTSSLPLEDNYINDSGNEDMCALEHNDDLPPRLARKIDFAAVAGSPTPAPSTHLLTSSPLTSALSSFIEQEVDLGLDSEPELSLLLPTQRSSSPPVQEDKEVRQRVVDVIDLSSSPPARTQSSQSQPSAIAASRCEGNSKIHTFFNSSKVTQSQSFHFNPKDRAVSQLFEEKGKSSESRHEIKTVAKKEMKKKIIVLCESLPGAWNEVDEDEADLEFRDGGREGNGKGPLARVKREGRWRMSQVEMLDLSAD